MIESPKVTLDQDGIIWINFENLLITFELAQEGLRLHRVLAPLKKSKVLLIGEAAAKIDTDMVKFGASEGVVALTSAVAMVPHKKIGRILVNLFLTLQTNPYPTRAFDSVDDAREWLLSLEEK